MNSTQSILERVNPISNTGKMTLCQLAEIGDEDCILISKKLNLNYSSIKSVPEDKIISRIIMEVRYRTIESMFEKTGYNTLLDLPCGFISRGLSVSRKVKSI